MRKIAAAVISVFLALVLLPSCSEGVASNNDSSASADTTGQKETAATPKTEQEPDEEELYYYNPKLTKCYRKNDNTILFTLDTKVKDPDGNLYEHIYIASTPDGEPIAKAVSADSYGGEMSDIWGANFDVTIPETVYLCFKALESDNVDDADLKTVLCDIVELGIYGETKLSDGSRVAAVQTGSEVIEATLWVDVKIDFNAPEVTYYLPADTDIFLLHEPDGKSVLLTAWSGPGASVEYTFTGTSVNVYSNVENDSVTNDLQVYLDGELVETYDSRPGYSFLREGLTYGEHTVKLVSGEGSTTVSSVQGEANKWMFYISGFRYSKD